MLKEVMQRWAPSRDRSGWISVFITFGFVQLSDSMFSACLLLLKHPWNLCLQGKIALCFLRIHSFSGYGLSPESTADKMVWRFRLGLLSSKKKRSLQYENMLQTLCVLVLGVCSDHCKETVFVYVIRAKQIKETCLSRPDFSRREVLT